MTPLYCLIALVAWAVISAAGAAWIFRPSQRQPEPAARRISHNDEEPDTFSAAGWWLSLEEGSEENPEKRAKWEDAERAMKEPWRR